MAIKSQEILLKGNTTNASAVPSSLKVREIAINALDRSLFTNDGNSIVKLYTGTTKWFDVNGNANNALKADSVAWAGISGKPTTFTPASHQHEKITHTLWNYNNAISDTTSPVDICAKFNVRYSSDNALFTGIVQNSTGERYQSLFWTGYGAAGLVELSKSYGIDGRLKYRVSAGWSDDGANWAAAGYRELANIEDLTWTNIKSKPTTIAGYGITDNVAYRETGNNFIHNSNEFTFASPAQKGSIYINYRTSSGTKDGAITDYCFYNGAGLYANLRAAKYIIDGGTSAQFLKADGSLDSTAYLPLSGGKTITGSFTLADGVNITNSKGYGIFVYDATNTVVGIGTVGAKTKIRSNDSGLIHERQGTDYVILDQSNALTLLTNGNTLLHSGNYNSYAPTLTGTGASGTWGISISGNAATADVIATTYKNQSINFASNESKIRLISSYSGDALANGFPTQYVGGISAISSYVGWQMVTYGSSAIPNPYFRMVYETGDYSDWKKLAFLTDNVASAQNLTHSNGTIGATVGDNGRLYISRYITFDGDGNRGIYRGSLFTGAASDTDIVYSAENRHLFYTGSNWSMFINSSGNVTLGTSDLASSVNRLFVYDGAISGDIWADAGQVMLVSSNAYYLALTTNESGYSELQSGQRNIGAMPLILQKKGGNVGIGTGTPHYKLDVDGTSRAKLYYAKGLYSYGYNWNNGAGGLNVEVPNDIGQTPLVVGYRTGTSPVTAGVDRLFALELLDTGDELRYSWGGAEKHVFYNSGNVKFLGKLTVTGDSDVNGDAHITGNLIVDGEVSALVA